MLLVIVEVIPYTRTVFLLERCSVLRGQGSPTRRARTREQEEVCVCVRMCAYNHTHPHSQLTHMHARMHTRTHTPTLTHPHPHPHPPTHPPTHTRTHTPQFSLIQSELLYHDLVLLLYGPHSLQSTIVQHLQLRQLLLLWERGWGQHTHTYSVCTY